MIIVHISAAAAFPLSYFSVYKAIYHESVVLWYITPKFTGKPSIFRGDAPNFRIYFVHRSHLTIFGDTWRITSYACTPPKEATSQEMSNKVIMLKI